MQAAYPVLTIVFALMVLFSGIAKIRRDPRVVQGIHETIGIPLKYFPLLAACEFAGAAGLLVGVWWRLAGIAAAIGLVVYFIGAVVSHLRVKDLKGVGPAIFMLVLAGGALALRLVND